MIIHQTHCTTQLLQSSFSLEKYKASNISETCPEERWSIAVVDPGVYLATRFASFDHK